jgi:hypothetical protein
MKTIIKTSGFSIPPIKTDRHHKTEKFLSAAKTKITKQSINESFVNSSI